MAAAPVQGAQDDSRLQEINKAIAKEQKDDQARRKKAAAIVVEVRELRGRMIAAAKATQKFETEVTRIEGHLGELVRAESIKAAKLAERREQFALVLSALQRIARHPPESLIAQPLDANSLVRSAILLRTAVPEIESRTAELRREIGELETLRAKASAKRTELASATSGMEKERTALDALIGKKQALKRRADARSKKAERRINQLARQAKDLRELMARIAAERKSREQAERKAKEEAARLARIEAEKRAKQQRKTRDAKIEAEAEAKAKAEAQAKAQAEAEAEAEAVAKAETSEIVGIGKGDELVPITQARGKLPFPASGHVVIRYGQATETGMTQKGISIKTRDGARVVAPYDGLVVFAGQFRGYGQILILEHGEGYHTLLAGLTRIDTVLGQWLASGEPVGLMEKGDRDAPVLYVELRRNGQPINPLPWLASQKDKVSG
ncbi:MAG: peptidoglycan DD-metalloendopeptidase family protein [Rhodospirillales bacterium]|nr:peptidoglycan DD-metalloendopeptidase family protein [Rhodospirillales bacterium]